MSKLSPSFLRSEGCSPTENTPAKNTPAKNTPAKNTPAKNTPAKNTPAKNTVHITPAASPQQVKPMHWHTFPAQGGPQARTPAASLFGLLCLIAGGLQAACIWIPHGGSVAGSFLGEAFVLNYQKLAEGHWWSLLGFSLAHTGFWHWAVGALGFYVVSRSVEPIIGGWHLLGVTLLGNIFSGGVHCLASLWGALPPGQPLMGMLPALFTLVGVYATVLPGWRLGAASRWRGARWCATRLHAPRARHTAWLAAAGAALWWAADWRSECGPAALLPALCTGWAYTRMLGFGDRLFFRRLMEDGDLQERRMELMNWEEFLNAELNPVLEKIARHGLRSLNASERRILRHSRRKLEGW